MSHLVLHYLQPLVCREHKVRALVGGHLRIGMKKCGVSQGVLNDVGMRKCGERYRASE